MYHGLSQASNARVIFVDMNAFFASVEQQSHPNLRDLPVGVVSHVVPNGTVLAASYEAKALGISTGTKVRDALRICPEIKLVTPTPSVYKAIHKRFLAILDDLAGPEVVPRSIDEAAIFLSPNWQTSEQARNLALTIKERFSKELGPYIRCSIGIAPNSFLAKVATNLQKPNGLVEITLENLPEILSKLELTDLPGIAERYSLRLMREDIMTPLGLYNLPAYELKKRFGIWGQYWWWRLHGYETDNGSKDHHKTMSHEHVLKKWIPSIDQALPTLLLMGDRVCVRLIRNHLQCQSIAIGLRLSGARPLYAERRFDAPTNNQPLLMESLVQLCKQLPAHPSGPIRKATIMVNGLVPSELGRQLDCFDEQVKSAEMTKAITLIRNRFGFEAIQTGTTAIISRRAAPEQLGFGRVKDVSYTAHIPG
jgi:DNA polymerase-4